MNAIVVSAGESDLKRIGDLVKKLDTDQVGRVSEIRIFPLLHGRADSISTILNTALNTKPVALNEQSPNTRLPLAVHHSGDRWQRTDRLRAEGRRADHPGPAHELPGRLRSGGLHEPARADYYAPGFQHAATGQDQSVYLINADARLMAELLMTLFRLQPTGQPGGVQRAIQYTLRQGQAAVRRRLGR